MKTGKEIVQANIEKDRSSQPLAFTQIEDIKRLYSKARQNRRYPLSMTIKNPNKKG
jgi:hypothetical protein